MTELWYQACSSCTAKWCSRDKRRCCPRCGAEALPAERRIPPWACCGQQRVTRASKARTAASTRPLGQQDLPRHESNQNGDALQHEESLSDGAARRKSRRNDDASQ